MSKRLTKTQRKHVGRTAARMPAWVTTAAATLSNRTRKGRLGKLGAASAVRRIDPATGEVIL